MKTLTQHFGISKIQAELDFVDIKVDRDLPLFIDPYVFSAKNDAWSLECNSAIISFFQATLDCIRNGQDDRGQRLLNSLAEPNETCLGLSNGQPSGKGVSGKQAQDLFERLAKSQAARTGLLSELSDCDLFVEGIGPDKISDITTNIIRRQLIAYTKEQCKLIGIPLTGTVASGSLWDPDFGTWNHEYVELPVVEGRKFILVPKASVRWALSFSPENYYNHFVLDFLQADHLDMNSHLVEVLRNGDRRVTKRNLRAEYPLRKSFLTTFTEEHPAVLEEYKRQLRVPRELTDIDLEDGFDERKFARALITTLKNITPGQDAANGFHQFMIGALEFLFYPSLIYPTAEFQIHEGRKRIDIKYTNNASEGFFSRRLYDPATRAINVLVECKNYVGEIANPELDQIAGRFSPARGRLGLLIGRGFDDRARFLARCRDTARDDRGFIIALVDDDIVQLLTLVEGGDRAETDRVLENRFSDLNS